MMEQELKALRAETIAVQAVLTNVLFELKLLDPVARRHGFSQL